MTNLFHFNKKQDKYLVKKKQRYMFYQGNMSSNVCNNKK